LVPPGNVPAIGSQTRIALINQAQVDRDVLRELQRLLSGEKARLTENAVLLSGRNRIHKCRVRRLVIDFDLSLRDRSDLVRQSSALDLQKITDLNRPKLLLIVGKPSPEVHLSKRYQAGAGRSSGCTRVCCNRCRARPKVVGLLDVYQPSIEV